MLFLNEKQKIQIVDFGVQVRMESGIAQVLEKEEALANAAGHYINSFSFV